MSQSSSEYREAAALVEGAAPGLTGAPAEQVLAWALQTFPRDRVALCTSFQDEGMVLLDMAWRVHPHVQVFTVDTGRLPQPTLDLIDEVRARYSIDVEVLYPDARELGAMVSEHGPNLFYRSPELRLQCCEARKVRPFRRKLEGLDAWISGLRRDQNSTRAAVAPVEVDEVNGGIVKVNPLAGWSTEQVMAYVERYRLPRNALYARGYTSIGCDPCTRATTPGDDPRAGRWWWEQGDSECGLHYELTVLPDGTTRVATARGPARA